jgi:hypothetical protein
MAAVANRLAWVTVRENKSVPFFLDQMRNFGASSLKLIRKKHPEFDRLFGIRWYESRPPVGFLVRSVIESPLAAGLEKWISVLPAGLRDRLVHLLVFMNMGKGYLSKGPGPKDEYSENEEGKS